MGVNAKKRSPPNEQESFLKKIIKHLTVFMDTHKLLWKELKEEKEPPLFYLSQVLKYIQKHCKIILNETKSCILQDTCQQLEELVVSKSLSKTCILENITKVEHLIHKTLCQLVKMNSIFLLEDYKLQRIIKTLSDWVRIMIFTVKNKIILEQSIEILKSIDKLLNSDLLEKDVHDYIPESLHYLVRFMMEASTMEEKTIILTGDEKISNKIKIFLQELEKGIKSKTNTYKIKSLLQNKPTENKNQCSIYDFIPPRWRKVLEPLDEKKMVIGREKKSKRVNSKAIYQENTKYLQRELNFFGNTGKSFYEFLIQQNKKNIVFVDVQNICRVSFLYKNNTIIEDFVSQPNIIEEMISTLFEKEASCIHLKSSDSFWIMVNKGNVIKDNKTGMIKILQVISGTSKNILHVKVACFNSTTGTDLYCSLGGDEMDDIFIVNAILDLHFHYTKTKKFPFSSVTVLSHDSFSNFKEYSNLNCPLFFHPKNLIKKKSEKLI